MRRILHPEELGAESPPLPPLRASKRIYAHRTAGQPAREAVSGMPEISSQRPDRLPVHEVDEANWQVRPHGDRILSRWQTPRNEDLKTAAMLRAQLRDLLESGAELRQDLDELQRRDQEMRARAHSSWAEQRHWVEETRQEYRVAVSALQHEVRSRLEVAEQKQRDLVLEDRNRREQTQTEVGEIWGALAAVRGDVFRSEQVTQTRSSEMLRKVGEVTEGVKAMAEATSRDAYNRAVALGKKIETIKEDMEEVRRVQGVYNIRIDSELKAGRSALARTTAATGRAGAFAATAEHDVIEQLRGEFLVIEQRVTADVAATRAALREEILWREQLTQQLDRERKRDVEATEERVRICEVRLMALITGAKKRTILEEKTEVIVAQRVPGSKDDGRSGGAATSGLRYDVDEMAAQLKARLQGQLAEGLRGATFSMGAAVEQLVTTLRDVRVDVEAEASSRTNLEASIATTVESAVRGVAQAARKELAKNFDATERLESKIARNESRMISTLEARCTRVEDSLVDRVTERERGFVHLRGELKLITRALTDKIEIERTSRCADAASAAADARKRIEANKIRCVARAMAADIQSTAVARVKKMQLDDRSRLCASEAAAAISAQAAEVRAQLALAVMPQAGRLAEAETRARCAEAGLQNKQDIIEVRAALADVISSVVEASHMLALDAAIRARVTADAVRAQGLQAQFAAFYVHVSRGVAWGAADRALAVLRNEGQRSVLLKFAAQLESQVQALADADASWQARAAAIDTVAADVAVHTATRRAVQALVNAVVDRQRQAQAGTTDLALVALDSKLDIVTSGECERDDRLEKQLLRAEKATTEAVDKWRVAVRAAAVTVWPDAYRHISRTRLTHLDYHDTRSIFS